MTHAEFKHHILPVCPRLMRIAVSLLRSREEAEDTLQEVMLRLWQRRGELTGLNSIEAFSITMTKNLCLDKLKSYKSRNQHAAPAEDFAPDSPEPDPEAITQLNDSYSLMMNCFDVLSEQQRLLLQLREMEQFSYDEIAECTGMRPATIRVMLSRARKKARDEYMRRSGESNV
jgi:RNA polymerase sigma-70 factor (ECF subfamily)